ncbi:MAG: Mce protein [Mycolicibacterium sp.]|uniref:Mce protein n=1 Tax=Mycolicibacterium sp. TaxID=2320850 RepID=UPI003D0C8B7B
MADDAAAPDGELTESTSEPNPKTDSADTTAVESESAAVEPIEGDDESTVEDYEAEAGEDSGDDEDAPASRAPMSHVKLALIAGMVAVVALAGLTGWLGFRTYESNQAEAQRNLFLQVGRQGALNLTTIGYENAEADVQRILDSATGTFYDDFQQRAQPFVEVVKQAQSTSVGTIAEAGLESVSGNEAQVLVAVTVETSNAGAPEQGARAWRMRITVQKQGDEAKVSNVEFVP